MITMFQNYVALQTLIRREVVRFMRIWVQTILPPAITMTLYFIIFGNLIGPRIGDIEGFNYIQYIVPGLIMMSIITNAYANVVSSFFSMRFQKSIEEMLISPMSNLSILIGFLIGGVLRGLLIGVVVTIVALFFTHLDIRHYWITFSMAILAATLFSLAGFTNAIFAKKFDDISIVPTFILTPLTYLGGVFYSIKLLPEFWQIISLANPILYMVNAFRYGILGASDVNVGVAFGMTLLSIAILFALNLVLLNRGIGIRE